MLNRTSRERAESTCFYQGNDTLVSCHRRQSVASQEDNSVCCERCIAIMRRQSKQARVAAEHFIDSIKRRFPHAKIDIRPFRLRAPKHAALQNCSKRALTEILIWNSDIGLKRSDLSKTNTKIGPRQSDWLKTIKLVQNNKTCQTEPKSELTKNNQIGPKESYQSKTDGPKQSIRSAQNRWPETIKSVRNKRDRSKADWSKTIRSDWNNSLQKVNWIWIL